MIIYVYKSTSSDCEHTSTLEERDVFGKTLRLLGQAVNLEYVP